MTAEYNFVLDYNRSSLITKTVGTSPRSVTTYRDQSGIIYALTADTVANRFSICALSGLGGVISDAVVANATLITKTVGTEPISIAVYRDESGIVYALTADSNNSRFSICALSASNGIISSAVVANATLITKTVGANPTSIAVYRDENGIIYALTADTAANRFSICALSASNGIISDVVIANATLITKTVGLGPRFVTVYRDQSGVVYAFTADISSNRFSICALSGSGGVISDVVVANATLITKTVGIAPVSIAVYQDQSGIIYALTADSNNSRFSICALSGSGGVISSAVVANATLITKTVGATPNSIAVYRDENGIIYALTADFGINRFSVCALSGANGIISSVVIGNAVVLNRNVGVNPNSIAVYRDIAGAAYVLTADRASNRFSLFNLSSAPFTLDLVAPTSTTIVNGNIATLEDSRSYLNFQQLVEVRAFSVLLSTFGYIRTGTLSGTVIAGKTLIFSTAASDITEAGSIRIEGTLRLGRKAGLYSAPFTFANGSVLEVFPDSDRAGAPLNLANQVFNATTTINATSGTATVLVSSLVGIVAGAGVSVIVQTTINFTGIIAGSVIGIFNHLGTLVNSATVAATTHSYAFSSPGLVNYTARIRRYGYAGFTTTITLSAPTLSVTVAQLLDPFVTLSEAAAGALTGIAINYGTSLMTGSIDRTPNQYYDFVRHSISLLANIGVVAAAIATSDGQNYALNFGLTLSGSSTITGEGSLGVGSRILSLGAAQTYSFLASVGAAGRVSIPSGETTIPNFTFISGATIDNRAATAAIAYVLRTQIASITAANTGGGAIAVLAQKFTLAAPNFKDPTYPISVALIRQETFTITDAAINVSANTVTLTGHRLAIASPGSFLAFVPVGGAVMPTVAGGSIQALGLYFVRSVAGNTITLSQAIGGAELDFTSAGLGTFVVRAWTRVDAATVPGGSATGYSYSLNDPAGTVFLLKARGHQSIALPATATKYQQSELSWGDANQTVSDVLNYTATPDSVYNTYTADTALPDDGELITYLSVDLTNGNVQFDLGVGTSAIKRTEEIYQWFTWYTSTPAGLLYLGLVAGALNTANLFVDPPIQLQNVNDGTVLTLEGAFLRRSDGGQLVFADLSSGSIILAPNQLAVGYTLASGGGGGGLTGQQDTRLTEIHQVSTTPRLR